LLTCVFFGASELAGKWVTNQWLQLNTPCGLLTSASPLPAHPPMTPAPIKDLRGVGFFLFVFFLKTSKPTSSAKSNTTGSTLGYYFNTPTRTNLHLFSSRDSNPVAEQMSEIRFVIYYLYCINIIYLEK